MALDSSDFELLKSVRRVIREGDTAVIERLERLEEQQRESLALQRDMLEAFNRLARAVEGLREDLTPTMDKPKLRPASLKR